MTDTTNERELARGWDESEEVANRSGTWIKLNPGESVKLNICSVPRAIEKTFAFNGEEPKTVVRYTVDVYVPGAGLRIWEMSKTTFTDIKRQRTKRGKDFENAVFEVERRGTGTATKYMIDYAGSLSPEEVDQRNASLIKGGQDPADIPF